MMPTALEQPRPFATEMERGYLTQGHDQQLGRKIGGQLPVAFDSLRSEFLFRVLAEELAKDHSERGRKRCGNRGRARLGQLELPEFLCTPLCLCVYRLLLAREADVGNQSPVLA